MEKFTFVLGFLPWIVFTFVAQRLDANGVAWSATIAVAMTLVALVVARRRHGPKILNLGSLAGLPVTVLDAHAVDASRNNVVDLLLNWVVPVIWAMVKFTASYPDRVRRPAVPQAGGARPAGGAAA